MRITEASSRDSTLFRSPYQTPGAGAEALVVGTGHESRQNGGGLVRQAVQSPAEKGPGGVDAIAIEDWIVDAEDNMVAVE